MYDFVYVRLRLRGGESDDDQPTAVVLVRLYIRLLRLRGMGVWFRVSNDEFSPFI